MSWPGWLAGLLVIAGAVFGLVKLLRVSGSLLPPMAVYGFVLLLLVFSTFCGLVRFKDKCTWGILFAGAVIFTCSDACGRSRASRRCLSVRAYAMTM